MFNIIGDVGGKKSCLERLMARMPPGKFIFVGDLNDRGEDSKGVIELVMGMQDAICLDSNHGHLMTDWVLNDAGVYGHDCWLRNGGYATLFSYGVEHHSVTYGEARQKIPPEHLAWLATRPKIFETDDMIVSHAAISFNLEDVQHALVDDRRYENGDYILWTRNPPRPRGQKFQVFGHNASRMGLCWFTWKDAEGEDSAEIKMHRRQFVKPEGAYAVCIDDSKKDVLTGLHWPTMEVFQEPFLCKQK